MSTSIPLVLDANILIRGVLGYRVLSLLQKYQNNASYYAPEVCFDDARRHILNLVTEKI